MADPQDLTAPTNADPIATDEFLGTAGAGLLREVRVPKETASILVAVTESDGVTAMGFYIQGSGVDGVAVGEAMYFAPGSKWTRTAAREDPARGRIEAVDWTFLVAGESANPTIQVISDFSGCP
jgi:hypothetical protein